MDCGFRECLLQTEDGTTAPNGIFSKSGIKLRSRENGFCIGEGGWYGTVIKPYGGFLGDSVGGSVGNSLLD